MRVQIAINSKSITKKIKTSSFLANIIIGRIGDYRDWLSNAGIESPKTKVYFRNGELIFIQKRFEDKQFGDYKVLIQALNKLNFTKYGIDSNPNNFLGQNIPILIDFYPFLVRDDNVLVQQFTYSLKEVYARYFTIENVLICYLVRLFRDNDPNAIYAFSDIKSIIYNNFDTVLPREKLRLLQALQLYQKGNLQDFSSFYEKTKLVSKISDSENLNLKRYLTLLVKSA